jgi:hypothetical protein
LIFELSTVVPATRLGMFRLVVAVRLTVDGTFPETIVLPVLAANTETGDNVIPDIAIIVARRKSLLFKFTPLLKYLPEGIGCFGKSTGLPPFVK